MEKEGLVIRTRYESFSKAIQENYGPVVLYGMTFWTMQLIQLEEFKVDYVCDKKAMIMNNKVTIKLLDIPVVDIEYLENIKGDGRATIIVCVDTNMTYKSICNDLMTYDLYADVFYYFDNEEMFVDRYFQYKKYKLHLYEHPYNCGYANTRMTERSVELALGKRYIEEHDSIYEIGAVTPYYFNTPKIQKIIDPTDKHKRVLKASLFDIDLKGRNVLSISTVEHIGTNDYGMHEEFNSIDAINKILQESKSCLITAPYGYNSILDEWVKSNRDNVWVRFLERKINNHWEEKNLRLYNFDCMYTSLWANGLIIIEK